MQVGRNGRLDKMKESRDCHPAAIYKLSKRRDQSDSHAASIRRSMFGPDDKDILPLPVPSPKAPPALLSVCSDDDGVSRRSKISHDTLLQWVPLRVVQTIKCIIL